MDNDDEYRKLREIISAVERAGQSHVSVVDLEKKDAGRSNKKHRFLWWLLCFVLLVVLSLVIYLGVKYEFKGLPGLISVVSIEILIVIPLSIVFINNAKALGVRFWTSIFSPFQREICRDFYHACKDYIIGLLDPRTSMTFLTAGAINIMRFVFFHLIFVFVIFLTIMYKDYLHPFLLSKFFYIMLYVVSIISIGFFENSFDKKGAMGAICRFLAPTAYFAGFLFISATIIYRLFFVFMLAMLFIMALYVPIDIVLER